MIAIPYVFLNSCPTEKSTILDSLVELILLLLFYKMLVISLLLCSSQFRLLLIVDLKCLCHICESEERKAKQAWKASVIGTFRRYKSLSNAIQGIYSQNTFTRVSQIQNHIQSCILPIAWMKTICHRFSVFENTRKFLNPLQRVLISKWRCSYKGKLVTIWTRITKYYEVVTEII